jgi:hypothetical protein
MGTQPVRIPENSYEQLRKTAMELDVSLSEAAKIVLEHGFSSLDTGDYISLDPDLNREFQDGMPYDSDTGALEKLDELQQRQRERNRERSDLSPEPQ